MSRKMFVLLGTLLGFFVATDLKVSDLNPVAVQLAGASAAVLGDPTQAGATLPDTAPIRTQPQVSQDPAYLDAIERTAAMVYDENAIRLAAEYGLDIVNVMWEDTGRYYDSAVGPNISDVTIQVQYKYPDLETYGLALMPVIRYPNFTDHTADISIDDFYMLVGNEKGQGLERVSLREYLRNFRRYLHDGDSWAGRQSSLLARRDHHVLVSAQAAFLPIPKDGQAKFNPVIFNYQSFAGDPAVLTIVATREGTSATIIDNTRNAFPAGWSWGQRLFHNQNGERASFTGQRLSDFQTLELDGRLESGPGVPEAAGENGLNMVLMIQVPLRQKNPMTFDLFAATQEMAEAPAVESDRSNVEAAVIGHGAVEGAYTEIDNLAIVRDERFPIRVTVQFYKATSNGVVSEADMAEIAAQIQRVYEDADYVGSLVVGGPSERPTEYEGTKIEPAGWWDAFWKRFEKNTELDRFLALEILRDLGAIAWQPVQ